MEINEADPVSYTHLDVYKRQEKEYAECRTSHIPVLLLTALGEEQNILDGLDIGADEYIVKPFSIRILKALSLIHIFHESLVSEIDTLTIPFSGVYFNALEIRFFKIESILALSNHTFR